MNIFKTIFRRSKKHKPIVPSGYGCVWCPDIEFENEAEAQKHWNTHLTEHP